MTRIGLAIALAALAAGCSSHANGSQAELDHAASTPTETVGSPTIGSTGSPTPDTVVSSVPKAVKSRTAPSTADVAVCKLTVDEYVGAVNGYYQAVTEDPTSSGLDQRKAMNDGLRHINMACKPVFDYLDATGDTTCSKMLANGWDQWRAVNEILRDGKVVVPDESEPLANTNEALAHVYGDCYNVLLEVFPEY